MGGSEEQEELAKVETDRPRLGICLVSGGMDSCVTAAIAVEENDELAFRHVSYGQLTEDRETSQKKDHTPRRVRQKALNQLVAQIKKGSYDKVPNQREGDSYFTRVGPARLKATC